jgi:YD repeat-containing protein
MRLLLLFLVVPAFGAEFLYQYDPAGRLVTVSFAGSQTISYRYDAAGNILGESHSVFVDSDQDQLPDDWEILHFDALSQGPDDDADGDGFGNLEEYLAGTDPEDELSLLRVVALDLEHPAGTELEISTVAGKRYLIQSKDLLTDPSWSDRETVEATGPLLMWLDTEGGLATRFYRVSVVP